MCSLTWDSVEFILFSFSSRYWVSITRFQDTRLISDKTKIHYCLFPCGQLFSLSIHLTRLTIPRMASSFKGEAFSFLSVFSARHDFGISGFFRIPNYVFPFIEPKGNCICVFTLRRINGNKLVSIVWKFTTCWHLGCLFLSTNHGRRFSSLR